MEARAAVLAAEAVSRAAIEAQAAAQTVLAELEAARAAEPQWELHTGGEACSGPVADASVVAEEHYQETAAAPTLPADDTADNRDYEIKWEPDFPQRRDESSTVRANFREMDDWRENLRSAEERDAEGVIEVVEPALPIHANLIQFPREIVATRKVRPRRAEGPYAAAAEAGAQLSIFEVDPGAISTDPAPAEAIAATSLTAQFGAEWSGIELDAQPQRDLLAKSAENIAAEELQGAIAQMQIEQAPMNLRLMAMVVDFALIVGAFLGAAMVAVSNMKGMMSLREVEAGSALGIMLFAAAYMALFSWLATVTPGMRYAGISLCTLDGMIPTRSQRISRLVGMLLSVLPMGLGMVWAIFDEDHLSWHDRLSRTYLHRN